MYPKTRLNARSGQLKAFLSKPKSTWHPARVRMHCLPRGIVFFPFTQNSGSQIPDLQQPPKNGPAGNASNVPAGSLPQSTKTRPANTPTAK